MCTRRSLGHHLLHPLIQIPNAFPGLGFLDGEGLREVSPGRPNIERWPPLEVEGLCEVPPDPELSGSLKGEGLLEVSPDPSKTGS